MLINDMIKTLPDSCGVYCMRSQGAKVLYIGKALSIRKRVKSHFRKDSPSARFIDKVIDIDCTLCETEEQALILEATLIKEHTPKYNVELKDDKSYPYLAVTKEQYPRVFIARGPQLQGKDVRLFGPFTHVKLLRSSLERVRRIFPYCSCRKPRSSCLYYHLRLCPGPEISEVTPARYKENIENICKVFSGARKSLIGKLQKQMERYAKLKKYEEAARVRDTLVALYSLYSGQKQASEVLILKEVLGLKKIPFCIEAIDISCLSGEAATGSVVVLRDGLPDKSQYRRYKIKGIRGPDDYEMIAQVVSRRYRRLKDEGKRFPDLIVIDGGPGQVTAACRELNALGVNISLIGIAKRNEEIWFPKRRSPLIISRQSPALHLIQRIRDEAHRFAHQYHTLLRSKKIQA